MKKMNKGAISIFALLSMMFFLIFIMVAYNNVMQKAKTQVETEGILVDYYNSTQSAEEIINSKSGTDISIADTTENKQKKLKHSAQLNEVESSDSGNVNKYIYSNGKVYKIVN